MARSINKVILVGNLGKDADTQFTQSGTAVTRVSVATSRRWKDQQTDEWKEETNWTNVVVWRQEGLGQYLTKGKQIYVEGRLQTRSYEDKDGRKVSDAELFANMSGSGKIECKRGNAICKWPSRWASKPRSVMPRKTS